MKWGLGDSYDDRVVLPEKFRGWLDVTKPASTLGIIGFTFLASLFYFYYTDQPHLIAEKWSVIVRVCLATGLAHGASQAMNMAEDAYMDKRTPHKQNRPIPSGVVTEDEARTLAWFMILGALLSAFLINYTFGAFIILSVVLGIFYNLEPIRAKERIISVPWQAVSRGLISFPIVFSAYGDPFTPTPWALGVFMFFYVLGFQNSADIIDREVDERFGIKTFIVTFGVERTIYIASGCTLMMIAVSLISVELDLVESVMYSLLGIIPFCILMLFYMYWSPYSISEKTGNHPAWIWFYVGMVLTVLLPLLAEITNL